MGNLQLSEIWIYPIKSLGGIPLPQARVKQKGLEYDRRWMLVDEQGKFMTQRSFPQMALFKVALENNHITIQNKKNNAKNGFDINLFHQESIRVTVWKDAMDANEVSPEKSAWFSDQLNTACKLVFFPEENSRLVDENYAVNGEHVSLADGYPFLIIGQASLDDLNKRLAEPVPMNRFRPNFVFAGGHPYEEDEWKEFTIGKNRFIGVKNCGRCALPTVNQDTGRKGDEPLRTLATYRNKNSKVNFGQNAVAVDYGLVAIGDVITFGK